MLASNLIDKVGKNESIYLHLLCWERKKTYIINIYRFFNALLPHRYAIFPVCIVNKLSKTEYQT